MPDLTHNITAGIFSILIAFVIGFSFGVSKKQLSISIESGGLFERNVKAMETIASNTTPSKHVCPTWQSTIQCDNPIGPYFGNDYKIATGTVLK